MHLSGGSADKLGNRYEGVWTALQLLRLLSQKLQSVQLESLDKIGEGIDLIVTSTAGISEAQQCKKNNSRNNWSLRELARRGVLVAMRDYLRQGRDCRFSFISNREATDLKRLAELARQFRDDPNGFLEAASKKGDEARRWRAFCSEMDLGPSALDGFELLLGVEVAVFDDGERGREQVATVAELLLDGDPHDIVLRLADFAVSRMRTRIYADELREFVNTRTRFCIRDLAFSPNLNATIKGCQEEYTSSVRRHLIHGSLICRPEADEVFQSIVSNGKVRIHCVHGLAGQGKTCVLHELVSRLVSSGIPTLPLRFDQNVPKKNTAAYGQELRLPESPTRCLDAARGDRVAVLVLDQLDALRWTPQHDPTSWIVFERLVRAFGNNDGLA